jgi:putative transcriptional regulator
LVLYSKKFVKSLKNISRLCNKENNVPIIINLGVILAKRKVKSKGLAAAIGITEQNLSLFKQDKVKGFRLVTLESTCNYLDCQPAKNAKNCVFLIEYN